MPFVPPTSPPNFHHQHPQRQHEAKALGVPASSASNVEAAAAAAATTSPQSASSHGSSSASAFSQHFISSSSSSSHTSPATHADQTWPHTASHSSSHHTHESPKARLHSRSTAAPRRPSAGHSSLADFASSSAATQQQHLMSNSPAPVATLRGLQSNTSSATASSSSTSSPSHATSHYREEDDSRTRGEDRGRGTKSRRASSGGTRIPSNHRAASDGGSDRHAEQQEPLQQIRQQQQQQQAVPGPSREGGWAKAGTDGHALRSSPSRARQDEHQQLAPASSMRSPANDKVSHSPSAKRNASPSSVTHDQQLHSASSSSSSPLASSSSLPGSSSTRRPSLPHLDLASYPQQDLLRVLAALLHQITTSNDAIRPPGSSATDGGGVSGGSEKRGASKDRTKAEPPSDEVDGGRAARDEDSNGVSSPRSSNPGGVTTAAMGALGTPSSTLCFHARNIPSISIESYLLRILKYCPTTNDVFLSLLVYFDRMSRMASSRPSDGEGAASESNKGTSGTADSEREVGGSSDMAASSSSFASEAGSSSYAHPGMKGFAVDSYNVHRLVIAGITVASKFFSDVFYTNSRYAKVGGLPVHELNQLELQFLLLNDFNLVVPLDELQSYADQLLAYASGKGAATPVAAREMGAPKPATALSEASSSQDRNQDGERHAEGKTARSSAGGSSGSLPRPDRSAAAVVGMQER